MAWRRSILGRGLVFAALVVASVTAYRVWGDELTLAGLAAREAPLREAIEQRPALCFVAGFAIYVAVTILSIPGTTIAMAIMAGWLVGFWPAVVLISFASTSGATLTFLLARYLLRDWILESLGPRLAPIQRAVERDGSFYLLLMRLQPVVPFTLVNWAMAQTPLRAATFWWVSQLGMLPCTAIYVATGASLPSAADLAETGITGLISPALIASLVALGVFPLVVRIALRKLSGYGK